ncbi:hypothetical protein DL771_004273 [Monosporascus sp. 5C6A]|nr:hypothetical protein DL771_004273 [Monosporascus sp. 5C6A]
MLALSSSWSILSLGFGVYRPLVGLCIPSCLRALECGRSQIDTAQYYGSGSEVGEAVERFGIPRSSVFLTTKILGPGDSVENDDDRHIEELKEFAKAWPPHINQIELQAWNHQRGIVDYCHKNGIAIEAYRRLVQNTKPTTRG